MSATAATLDRAAWRDWLPVLLPWSCLLLLPFGRLVEVPVAVMALAGLVLAARRGRAWFQTPAVRLLTVAFLCIWIPMLLSSLDAVNQRETFRVVLNHLRFYLSGLYLVDALSTRERLDRFLMLSAWLLAVWMVDALVQWVVGVDLLGQGGAHRRVTGPFGTRSAKFGLVLATLAPLVVEHARRRWPTWATALAAIGLVLVVFIGGTRSGWVTAMLVAGVYVVLYRLRAGRFPWRALALATVGGVVLATTASLVSPQVRARVDGVAAFLHGGSGGTANALEHRRWIWRGGMNMFAANPLNGVGARSFRYAFLAHAEPDDPYVARTPPVAPAHSHQLVVEVLAETGAIGAIGLMLLALVLARAAWRCTPDQRDLLTAYGLCLVAAWWPINTHLALFSAFWSQFVWWLVGLYCAAYGVCAAESATTGHGDGTPVVVT